MKKSYLIIPAMLIGLILVLPDFSEASDRGGRHGAGYHTRSGHYHGYRHYAPRYYGHRHWYGPRVWVGPVYPYPYYYYERVAPPVYVGPPPAYAAPVPEQPQAYPDPALTDQGSDNPPALPDGSDQWVTVPGQWVDGVWVGEHKVRIP